MKTKLLLMATLLMTLVACTNTAITPRADQNTATTPPVTGKPTPTPEPTQPIGPPASVPAPTSTIQPVPKVSTKPVSIHDFVFDPASLVITAGTTVVWTNNDQAPHTVTSDMAGVFGSDTLATGQTYSHTFTKAGVYSYHCNFHPQMKAKIIVQ